MEKEKLLYIMSVDWNWIYQRPQILAEMLSRDYDVTVVFPRSVVRDRRFTEKHPYLKMRILWLLPFQEKNMLIGRMSRILNRKVFRDVDRFSRVLIGYPLYARYIPDTYRGKIIFDCMDCYEALYPDRKRVSRLREEETGLVRRCDLLLTSSAFLQKQEDKTAGLEKSVLLRNGFDIRDIHAIKENRKTSPCQIGYIGTIAEWFDYEPLLRSVDRMPGVRYHLIGPADRRREHPSLIYHGPVPHDQLWETVKDFDCLIMPFKVNGIVEAVDPVKLYEYIAFGKCIVSVWYEEVERFREFVYFYRNAEEYCDLLRDLSERGFPAKYDAEQQRNFLAENSWECRYVVLKREMEKL